MGDNIKTLFVLLTYIIGIICGIQMLLYRFQNPHLTGTELMIYGFSRYWWVFLMAVISGLVSRD